MWTVMVLLFFLHSTNNLKSLFTKLETLDGRREANQATNSTNQVIHHREKF